MAKHNFFFTILLIFISSQSINFSEGAAKTAVLVCPDAKSLVPCECLAEPAGLTVKCQGPNITQLNIDHALKHMEKLPNVHTFSIFQTELTELNLKSLSGHSMQVLNISQNYRLHGLIGSSTPNGKIKVKSLNLDGNALTDYGVRDTLLKFEPISLTRLNFFHNRLVGSQMRVGDKSVNAAFLPGLFTLKNLEFLGLEWNAITNIAGGQFRKNTLLKFLLLDMNHLEEVGEDAFLFEEDAASKKAKNEKLTINLSHNWLTDEKISEKSGLERIHRPTRLEMWANNFEYISKAKFHKFLMNNKLNEIEFGDIHPPMQWDAEHFGEEGTGPAVSGSVAETGTGTGTAAGTGGGGGTAAGNETEEFQGDEAHDSAMANAEMFFSSWQPLFICDGRMKWLKTEQKAFMNRIHNVTCSNDPPNTIFNTTLV